jgi:hypothetical protein
VKTISVTDLKLIDGLSHLNYMEMVHPSNDQLVGKYLDMIGIDITKPLEYRAYQHRNLQGQVVVNFLIAGDLKLDRKSLTSQFSTYEDRLIASSIYDRSLFEQLHELGNTSPTYGGNALDDNIPVKEAEEYKEEELKIANEIAQLEEILYHIRGSQVNPDGSFKSMEDYVNPKPAEKRRKKHKSRKNVEGNIDE